MNTETMPEAIAIAKVHARANPPVVMSLEDIATFLGYSQTYVKNNLQNKPGFPAKLPNFAHPRFSRRDVMAWAGVQP